MNLHPGWARFRRWWHREILGCVLPPTAQYRPGQVWTCSDCGTRYTLRLISGHGFQYTAWCELTLP